MIRLIASDMDGTFLDETGRFDREAFRQLLGQLEEREIPFVIASGNGLERLLQLFHGFEDRVYFISDNGARLHYQGETLYRERLTQEQVASVLAFFEGRWEAVCLMLVNDQAIYMQKGAGRPFEGAGLPIQEEQLEAFWDKIIYLDDLSQLPAEQVIYRAGFWLQEEQVEQETEAFNAHFAGDMMAVTSGYGSMDILQQGVHKAWGLEQLLEKLAISKEDVMAFGDSDNDIELLQYVGHSYAMDNATDKIKAVSQYRAPSNDANGVMTVIHREVLSEK